MIPDLEINVGSLDWLLEPDSPGVRYLALRDLVNLAENNSELVEAQARAHENGPIAGILANMQPEGYWVKPGAGYNPKYFSTVWSIILLAQLGARCSLDARIPRACGYLLDHALAEGGQFSSTGAPSGTVDCLQGNLCGALLDLGVEDPRLEAAFDWMARTVTGEGIAPNSETECETTLLCLQMRSELRLRSEQRASVCLGSRQGDAGLRQAAKGAPDSRHSKRHSPGG